MPKSFAGSTTSFLNCNKNFGIAYPRQFFIDVKKFQEQGKYMVIMFPVSNRVGIGYNPNYKNVMIEAGEV